MLMYISDHQQIYVFVKLLYYKIVHGTIVECRKYSNASAIQIATALSPTLANESCLIFFHFLFTHFYSSLRKNTQAFLLFG